VTSPRFITIALPVALTYLGLMTLGMVDLLLVGRLSGDLGPVAQGAVGIGTSFFSWFLVFGIGLLSSMDYFVSTAFGAGRSQDAVDSLVQCLWIATWLALPLTGALLGVASNLELFGIHPEVAPLASSYLKILSVSLWPVYLFAAARNFLQAIHRVWEGFALLVAANVLNYLLNLRWIPVLGTDGSAWATVVSRALMTLVLVGVALYFAKGKSRSFAPNFHRQWEHVRLGLPAALQTTAEVGVFAVSTILAGGLNPQSLAAHQIVLNLASLTFMVPLGIGTAAAVSVGFFVGRNEPALAARQGWTALKLTLAFMACTALLFAAGARTLLSFYSMDSAVLQLAIPVLGVAALFQLFDGTQTVLTGALRGWGDTRTAFLANVAGHWLIGLPLGVALGLGAGMGIFGIWIGLAVGLTAVAAVLIWKWAVLAGHPD
jgi:MATE family multidrug resistance protein